MYLQDKSIHNIEIDGLPDTSQIPQRVLMHLRRRDFRFIHKVTDFDTEAGPFEKGGLYRLDGRR
jgi:hypothetical protein